MGLNWAGGHVRKQHLTLPSRPLVCSVNRGGGAVKCELWVRAIFCYFASWFPTLQFLCLRCLIPALRNKPLIIILTELWALCWCGSYPRAHLNHVSCEALMCTSVAITLVHPRFHLLWKPPLLDSSELWGIATFKMGLDLFVVQGTEESRREIALNPVRCFLTWHVAGLMHDACIFNTCSAYYYYYTLYINY